METTFGQRGNGGRIVGDMLSLSVSAGAQIEIKDLLRTAAWLGGAAASSRARQRGAISSIPECHGATALRTDSAHGRASLFDNIGRSVRNRGRFTLAPGELSLASILKLFSSK